MAVKLQLNDISDCKIGGGSVTSIRLGTELVWPDSPTPYSSQYLTTEMMGGGTISLADAGSNVFYYSKDNGSTWGSLTTGQTVNVVTGDKVLWKASGLTISSSDGIGTIKPSASFRVYGNVMSLEYGDNFSGQTTMRDYNFLGLFYADSTLMVASNLVLPATTLSTGCYRSMFSGCSGLTTTPELPATTLADSCYWNMFGNCRSLTTAPSLSATTLADSCYNSMFYFCTSLTVAPTLPATTLTMYCYGGMFYGCRSLTTAPELPAATLTDYCYYRMFAACTSLNYIKCLATDISANNCTTAWVQGVASSGTFHKAPIMCDWTTGNNGIPSNWTVDPDDCGVGAGDAD